MASRFLPALLAVIVPVAPANAPVPPVTLPLVTLLVLMLRVAVPYSKPPVVSNVTLMLAVLAGAAAGTGAWAAMGGTPARAAQAAAAARLPGSLPYPGLPAGTDTIPQI